MKSTALTALGLALALLGPGAVALLARASTPEPLSLSAGAPLLGLFVLLVVAVATIAWRGEKLTRAQVGFGRMTWWSIPLGVALAAFFILVFGPLAYWALARSGLGSFDAGANALAALPAWYRCLTVIVVAAGEEWLYRGYAIERLQALTGHAWLAGAISLLAFGLVHLPLWGFGVALTTLVSGGILTALYIWRRDISFLILAHVVTDLYGLVVAAG
jgi:membrane protease YdiL (CAAX protease family)